MKTRSCLLATVSTLLAIGTIIAPPAVAQETERSFGQKLYVPVYSEIPLGVGRRTIRLSATLAIRNVDPRQSIRVTAADYYAASGELVHRYLSDPRSVPPLGSFELVVTESDLRGGISAAFLLQWEADSAVHAPLVQTIMLGTSGAQGISFVGESRVMEERRP